ncbi:MAG: ABC transporter ATP-binding protein [Syntrophorhabdales bacterium]|jgi:cobalt/nickel transport system ATP-binding protein
MVMRDGKELLQVRNVSYSYRGDISGLKEVTLGVREGEIFAIIGSNGSGKSTLLHIMDGLIHPTSGTVLFRGSELSERSLRDPLFLRDFRAHVGYIFQDPDVQLFCPTVLDELMFGPLQLGLGAGEAERRTAEVLDMLEIGNLAARPSYMLSSGEKKRVAIGSVLTMNPQVLLLDEPTNGLDPRTQCYLVELILALNDAGKSIVIATHDLSLVSELQCRVAVLSEEHRIEALGEADDILHDEALLLKVNLIHEHMHYHGETAHRHIHSHYLFHRHDRT